MNPPADQPARDKFIHDLGQNFSVVASAGSGKTRAITDRIVATAQSPHALEWLPSLVVVTFTNRAAGEMQQRARQRILEEAVPLDVLAAFNRVFFGTIHSFCVKLLRQFGHHLALPAQLDLLTGDDTLWMEFVQQQATVGATLPEAQRRCLQRLAPMRQLMELGRHNPLVVPTEELGQFPTFDFSAVFAVSGRGSGKANIELSQGRLRAWEEAWKSGNGFLPLPERAGSSADFVTAWNTALGPIRDWLRTASLHVAAEIAGAYRTFRLAKGVNTYDDQVALAMELLRQPMIAQRIREKNYRVILDEAQDTDPAQFDVLLELARPPHAKGAWLEVRNDPPRPGHFCMVGDFQQSIFGSRADLAHYRRVHETMLADGACEAVKFSVTFRLDRAQVDFVNTAFPDILHGAGPQVGFIDLSPRPGVLPGQVLRFDPGELPNVAELKDGERARLEASLLACWLREQGLERLRAQSWSEVAVLSPRKGWFPALHDALCCEGFEVQIQSERDLKGDSPAYAWFTALAVVMAEPHNGYELVGVLREIFGLSDHDLAAFAEGLGLRFQVADVRFRQGAVGDTLRLLASTHAKIAGLPLYSAMCGIVEDTRLRARLLALPSGGFPDLDGELDGLLTLAGAAEAEGKTLADFAGALRDGFNAVREVQPAPRDAVQLITMHKAKGSEWQAVIVPFFARRVIQRTGSYPRLLRDPRTGKMHAALSSEHIDEDLKSALDLAARQEMERLLYVALTRAKHTLVLVHDHELFTRNAAVPNGAQARLLRTAPGEPNADLFARLATLPIPCPLTAAGQIRDAGDRQRDQAIEPLPICPASIVPIARERAATFAKRNPSALAEELFAEATEALPRASGGPNSGALYGTWWHEFVECLDWSASPGEWGETFARALSESPDPARSRLEWTKLREALGGDTEIARWLRRGGPRVLREVPFLWAMNESECLEGVIDLAVWNAAHGAWLILDWKTNQETANLSAHYEPQISAYWKAAGEMLGGPIAAALFATSTGAWLPYDEARLAETWKKISRQPDLLAAAVVRDQ